MLLFPTNFRRSWIYLVFAFVIQDTSIGNKIPDWEFYWALDHEFFYGLGIWNYKPAWSAGKFVRKLMLLRENENSMRTAFQLYLKLH